MRVRTVLGTAATASLGLAAMLLAAPVPKDADVAPAISAEHLDQSAKNLKQILVGAHNFEGALGFLPRDIYSPDGKPLLSWRVALLPYSDGEEVYKEFRLTEAWDSPHNKALIAKMPKLYAPIRVKAKEGETFYRGFVGKGAGFESNKKIGLPEFTDGTSNTGFVFEAGEPTIWTKPGDLPFPEKADAPLPALGGLFKGYFHVGMVDGEVRLFRKGLDPATLRLLITRNDGYPIDFDTMTAHPKDVVARPQP